MSVLNAVIPDSTASWCRVPAIADLVEIFKPGVQVCSWQRSVDPNITTYLDGPAGHGTLQMMETVRQGDRAGLVDLPQAEGLGSLRDDVTFLTEVLCDLVGCQAVGLRCASVEKAMCPRWHVDHVPIRLLCTYTGPGTEWLEDQCVEQNKLASAETAGSACHSAATGEVVLLKGRLWQGNEGLGAIHRSPAIAAGTGRRVLVTLDPLWPD